MCSGVFEFWGARWRRSVMEGVSSAWLVEKLAYCRAEPFVVADDVLDGAVPDDPLVLLGEVL
jgi:hypothetical protein